MRSAGQRAQTIRGEAILSEGEGITESVSRGIILGPDERAELDRLRAEVLELRHQASTARPRHRLGWRGPVATLLIVLGCLLAPISVLAVWTATQVSDTSRYVENVTPLVHDPAVQSALTDKVTSVITKQLDVTAAVHDAASALGRQGLPRLDTLLSGAAPAISSALTSFIHGQVHKIVTGPAFARLWVQVNTVGHEQLVKALSGQGGGAVSTSNGQVTVSLGPFINVAKQSLAARGLTIVNSLPPVNPTLTLFSSKYLVQAQTFYRVINDLKIILPIAAFLLLAAGVYVARSHRRALIGVGLGLAVSMLVLAVGLLVARGIYLNSVPDSKLPADAAAAMYDTLVRFIRDGLRTLFALGLVVAAGAFLTGPSAAAVGTRTLFSSSLGWLRRTGEMHGVRTGPVGEWTHAHRVLLRAGAVTVAAVIFVFSGPPSVTEVVLIVVLLLVVLGLIELIGRPPAEPSAPSRAAGLVNLLRLVDTPDLAQRITHLADGSQGSQRLPEGIQQVLLPGRRRSRALDVVEPPRDLSAVPVFSKRGEPGGLLLLDSRIDPQRLVRLVLLGHEGVDAHNLALARVHLARDPIGGPLDLSLLEALLDRCDCSAE